MPHTHLTWEYSFTEPPCKVEELPPIDVVIISHNHYDHMDVDTVSKLGNRPHYFVPMGNKYWFSSIGLKDAKVTELDWWEDAVYQHPDGLRKLKLTSTPCQHFSSRSAFDRNVALWSSWAVSELKKDDTIGARYYFAGDTGYMSVPRSLGDLNPHDPAVYAGPTFPICPAFREIGDRLGPFDLACIPIGAYSPRAFMSPIHCTPEDAICLHQVSFRSVNQWRSPDHHPPHPPLQQDIRSRKSIGMHWATFILTDEDPTEPPIRLAQELKRKGLKADEFIVTEIGETVDI